MRVAVIGTGISGMVAAWMLERDHEVTVYEASSWVGGHTNTVDIQVDGRRYAIDTGFIVHNTRTYPNLVRIFDHLGVSTRATDMSFSVKEQATGLEYASRAILARRRNALNPRVLRMVRDILRFNREAEGIVEAGDEATTLGDLLEDGRYSKAFTDLYIVPMGAAIWSTDARRMLSFPAHAFVRFLINHGLTSLTDRPRWRVVEGGSREYVRRLTASFADRIRLETPVETVTRSARGVTVCPLDGPPEHYDRVVIATHSDQALKMLTDASDAEREILGAIRYQENRAVLHTDTTLLPRERRAWASWNYEIPKQRSDRVVVTYDMNSLQGIEDTKTNFCVTLNAEGRIDPTRVLYETTYHHPLYDPAALAAQKRVREISGARNTYYCGAYWRHGFHEDGVVSALAVAHQFGISLDNRLGGSAKEAA
ncbi:MAG: FAD-dependent oxidoreductase [Myxococcota bacterium]